jgi:inhibitor of cysteine peptidase
VKQPASLLLPRCTQYNLRNLWLPAVKNQSYVFWKEVNLQLDAEADGTTHQLKIGDVMAITLESNPSTGYAWFATSSNPDVLAQMGEAQYQAPKSSSSTPIVGAAGTETLYYAASQAGTTTLTLDYKRGWETDISPEKTVTIMVEVK